MRKLVVPLMLGVGLFAFGAGDARAASVPFCFDFNAFCDCLTVLEVAPYIVAGPLRPYGTVWENQDCAGTTSSLQGVLTTDGHNNNAGELDDSLGLSGVNWNFTWVTGAGVFDLDYWDGTTSMKVQDDVAYTIVPGACPADCSAALKARGLPPSTQR